MNKEEIINQVCNCFKMNITLNELEKITDDLQKKEEHQKQIIKSQYGTIKSINKTSQNRKKAIKSLLVQNEKLKKKAELGEHYKHLYNEVKKQKDDVVEYIKDNKDKTIAPYGDNEDTDFEVCLFEEDINELLRMLGETK